MNEHASMLRSWASGPWHPKLIGDIRAAAAEIERLEAELTSIAASLDNYARTEPDLSAAAEKAMRDLNECRVELAVKQTTFTREQIKPLILHVSHLHDLTQRGALSNNEVRFITGKALTHAKQLGMIEEEE